MVSMFSAQPFGECSLFTNVMLNLVKILDSHFINLFVLKYNPAC